MNMYAKNNYVISELTLRECALRTKKYFLTVILEKLIGRYLICLQDLVDHMLKYCKICIILEEDE